MVIHILNYTGSRITRASILLSKLVTASLMLLALLGNSVSAKTSTHRLMGEASYYAEFHHGKMTANGEIFNMHALTAAHRTLPLGTVIQVTNLKNNKSVKVRINDRGPYAKNRVIDLSKGAASHLGMIQSGVSNVSIKVLYKPTKNVYAKR